MADAIKPYRVLSSKPNPDDDSYTLYQVLFPVSWEAGAGHVEIPVSIGAGELAEEVFYRYARTIGATAPEPPVNCMLTGQPDSITHLFSYDFNRISRTRHKLYDTFFQFSGKFVRLDYYLDRQKTKLAVREWNVYFFGPAASLERKIRKLAWLDEKGNVYRFGGEDAVRYEESYYVGSEVNSEGTDRRTRITDHLKRHLETLFTQMSMAWQLPEGGMAESLMNAFEPAIETFIGGNFSPRKADGSPDHARDFTFMLENTPELSQLPSPDPSMSFARYALWQCDMKRTVVHSPDISDVDAWVAEAETFLDSNN